jgi:polysaccharide export outer membrane protein
MLINQFTKRASALQFSFSTFNLLTVVIIFTAIVFMAGCQTSGGTGAPSSASSSAPKGSPTEKAKSPGYQIGPEDVLHISVWKEEELNREVLVRPDGGISFPLAGNMQAAGKTIQELTKELTGRIQRYIPDAVVTVTVGKVSGYDIFVIGKVQKPGQYTLGQYVDVLQALTLAGGLTPFASEDNIRIQRRESGKVLVFPFEYSDIQKGRKLHQNIILQSGDVVVVP